MKGVHSLDTATRATAEDIEPRPLMQRLVTPHPERLMYLRYALREGHTIKELARITGIDPWFLHPMKEVAEMQKEIEKHPVDPVPPQLIREAKRMGISDARLAELWRI